MKKKLHVGMVIRPISIILLCLYSLAFSISTILGGKIDNPNKIMYSPNLLDIVQICIRGVLFFIIFFSLIMLLEKNNLAGKEHNFSIKRIVMRMFILLIFWVPYFLIMFPGSLSSDSFATLNQVLGNYGLHNHHPIMFTLFVKLCVKIGMNFGGLELGIALYSLMQMIIVAFSLSYVCEWIYIRRLPQIVSILTMIFYMFDGIIAIYSFTMWKDVLFSIWILLTTVFLYDLIKKDQKEIVASKQWGKFVLLCLLLAFGRNNGIYVVVLSLCGLLVLCKTVRKIILFRGIILVGLIIIVQGPIYDAVGVKKGHLAESLAVPLQQIAYTVYNEGSIGEEEKEFLNKIIPLEEMKILYNPLSADPIKFSDKFNDEFLEKNKLEFLKVWAKILPSNLGMYVKGYCMHTWGYWDIGINNWRAFYGPCDIDKNVKVQGTDFIKKYTGLELKDNIATLYEGGVNTIPVIKYLYNIAFSFWVAVFCGLVFILKKEYKGIIALVPLSGVWLTLMVAAPVFCEFRYMYSFHISLPVLFSMMFLPFIREKGEE